MKKIIRLTESELVSLVKRIIMENVIKTNTFLKENRFANIKTKGPHFYCENSFEILQINEKLFCKAVQDKIQEINKTKKQRGNKGFYAAFDEIIDAYFEKYFEVLWL
jgi:hypothetical protein